MEEIRKPLRRKRSKAETPQLESNIDDDIIAKSTVEEFKRVQLGGQSKYRPEMGLEVIEYMAEGRSKECCATLLGIASATFWKWIKKYETFAEAVEIGSQLSKLWWMEQGRKNINNNRFNQVLYMMNMSNRHGWNRKGELGPPADPNALPDNGKLKIEDMRTNDQVAETLRILVESGAIESGTKKLPGTKIN